VSFSLAPWEESVNGRSPEPRTPSIVNIGEERGRMPTAMVTGASRGIGRGVAIALADAGYAVFATGRNIERADLPGSIRRIPCDHTDDGQTERAFATVAAAGGGLDVLVNAAWGGYERMVEDGAFTWPGPFWEQPLHRWSGMIDNGLRAAFVASAQAARLMIPRAAGLIVNLSFWAAQKPLGNVIYGIAQAATDKMSADMAHELAPHGVSVVSLYPGLVRTERVLEAAAQGAFALTNSESPEFIGRVIAALAASPMSKRCSGQALVAAAVAEVLGVTDIDGGQPRPLTIADV
jgi:dehydrogenase/reductase SDR family protein 1